MHNIVHTCNRESIKFSHAGTENFDSTCSYDIAMNLFTTPNDRQQRKN